jgi:hypothetical protein
VSHYEYISSILERFERQKRKGLLKYGTQLEENTDLTAEERLEHLAEELTDALMYIEHLKKTLK